MFKEILFVVFCLPLMTYAANTNDIKALVSQAQEKVLEMENRAKEWFNGLAKGTKNPRKILSIISTQEKNFKEQEQNVQRVEISSLQQAAQVISEGLFAGLYIDIQKELLAKKQKEAEEQISRIEQYTKLALIANKSQFKQTNPNYKASMECKGQKLDRVDKDNVPNNLGSANNPNLSQNSIKKNNNSEGITSQGTNSEDQIVQENKSIKEFQLIF